MRTVRRFLLLHVLSAVGLVTLAFLALLFFIDMLNDLSNLGKPGFSLSGTLLHVALSMPSRAYEVLPIATLVGGVFVFETLSVILQVGYFKMSGGKRIFRMAPLHHHFELKGVPESKIIIRFWILSILMALMALSTLKLR